MNTTKAVNIKRGTESKNHVENKCRAIFDSANQQIWEQKKSKNTVGLLCKTQWQWEASEVEEMQNKRLRISSFDVSS